VHVTSSNAAPATRQTIEAIEVLRAIAALTVAFAHIIIIGGVMSERVGGHRPANMERWGAGVDLFFVISGFIMVHSAGAMFAEPRAGIVFLARRLARIVPLYWVGTAILLIGFLHSGAQFSVTQIATSLLFIPYAQDHSTTQVMPLLGQGWTLNFEMLFYGIFALCLRFDRQRGLLLIAMMLILLVAGGALFQPANVQIFTWTRPLLLEFLAGIGIATLYQMGWTARPVLRILAVVVAVIILAQFPGTGPHWQGWQRTLTYGIAATLLVAAAVAGPLKLPFRRLWLALGASSYTLYICHIPAVVVVGAIWKRTVAGFDLPAFVTLATVVIVPASVAIHYYAERPFTRYLNRRIARLATPPAGSGRGVSSQVR
jgi:exopolysaccharide production protein ExoZ